MLRRAIDEITEGQRPLLHAERLEFIHPQTHQLLKFQQPLPHDFNQALYLFEEMIATT